MLAKVRRRRNAGHVDASGGRRYPACMRLSDRKIDSLADKILHWLQDNQDVQCLAGPEVLRTAIVEEFREEKELERRLDEEVDRIMTQNETRMRHEGIDNWVMRKKIRQQLARERGIVL
jgi:hypothetical protein